ncbi:MAG: uracil-DNA glycosylase family protein [Pseudomonadota bacterium]
MSAAAPDIASPLHREIAACTVCADKLEHGVRPVVQFSATSRILIIGQAPSSTVHRTGVPWDDDSGERLRGWLAMDRAAFYDPARVALVPMGFCYPGPAKGGDNPPRPECAPLWHNRVLAHLPEDRLTVLLGTYAQAAYLPDTKRLTITARIERLRDDFEAFEGVIPLPHPAWRARLWMGRHEWFDTDILPRLRRAIAERL